MGLGRRRKKRKKRSFDLRKSLPLPFETMANGFITRKAKRNSRKSRALSDLAEIAPRFFAVLNFFGGPRGEEEDAFPQKNISVDRRKSREIVLCCLFSAMRFGSNSNQGSSLLQASFVTPRGRLLLLFFSRNALTYHPASSFSVFLAWRYIFLRHL